MYSPAGGIVSVWFATLDSADPATLGWLDCRERERYRRFSGDADRARFLLGASLFRAAIGSALGVSPDSVDVDRRCPECGRWHGPPRIEGSPLAGSVAHSGLLVAVALGARGRVGVDVEAPRRARRAELARWVEREARLKAGGGVLDYQTLTTTLPGYLAGVAASPAAEPLQLAARSGNDLLRGLSLGR